MLGVGFFLMTKIHEYVWWPFLISYFLVFCWAIEIFWRSTEDSCFYQTLWILNYVLYVRYTLKRKFDRGSYGEVWLAFHWNCSEESPGVNNFHPNVPDASSSLHSHEGKSNNGSNSSTKQNFVGSVDDDYFILKRIMVR